MTEAVYWIWGITLAIVAFVIVPVAWSLLNQALSCTKSICEYSHDMLQSGLGIAQNTSHTKQLGTTLEHATAIVGQTKGCLLYTSPSPRDLSTSRMPSSA